MSDLLPCCRSPSLAALGGVRLAILFVGLNGTVLSARTRRGGNHDP
jgi:hypothetical protein